MPRLSVSFLTIALVLASSNFGTADIINIDDVIPLNQGLVASPQGGNAGSVVGSGNGTLDLRLFTFSGAEVDNDAGAFDGDNASTGLPNGGSATSFNESYVTTAGDLQGYYDLNYGPNVVTDIAVYLDLNETGGGQPINTLDMLTVILNPATIQGSPDPTGDVTSSQQKSINQVFTGGTVLADLATSSMNLPVTHQGAGFADYAVILGINPYSLNQNDVLLFNFSMSDINSGAEELFISGRISAADILAVPEPGSLTGFMILAGWLVTRRRRK